MLAPGIAAPMNSLPASEAPTDAYVAESALNAACCAIDWAAPSLRKATNSGARPGTAAAAPSDDATVAC